LTVHARQLDRRMDNLYRVRAYRRAAEVIQALNCPVTELLDNKGRRGLEALPGIGSHLAFTIETLVRTGEFRTLSEAG
jgi:DNA polymerase/3'-5' exonuclease PolX